jgi:integrase
MAWCGEYGFQPFPYNDVITSLYLLSVHNRPRGDPKRSAIALNYWFKLGKTSGDIHSGLPLEIQKSSTRIKSKPSKPKTALSEGHFKQICSNLLSRHDIASLRLLTFAVLAFHGFFRANELLGLKWKDIAIDSECLRITLSRSKCSRVPETVVIGDTSKEYSPLTILSIYKGLLSQKSPPADGFVFPRLQKSYSTDDLIPNFSYALSYTTMLKLFKQEISEIGLDPSAFGLHSFRRGGTTAAVRRGIPERLIQRHGRWKTAISKDRYVEDSLVDKLSVSQCLNGE